MKTILTPLALAAATLLSACGTLAPDYQQPAAPVAATLDGAAASSAAPAANPVADLAWQSFFPQPALRELITQALDNNRDLRVALLNIDKARAQFQIQDAAQLPAIGAAGSGSAQRLPADLSRVGEATISRQYSATLGFTAFELDFFGRVRSLREQALAQYLATEEAARATRISLVAEVANAWLTLAADRELLALARDTVVSREKSLALIERSFELGNVSALDRRQAQAALESARVDAARYQSQVARDENALTLLVGGQPAPGLLPTRLDAAAGLPALPTAGLASSVLLARPDVLGAEQRLRAANANIGVARAAYFPSITLTAAAGTASASLDGLFKGGSGSWTFAPRIDLPIFDWGRREANLTVAERDRDIAVAQYERAIQVAFREVADTLAQRNALGDELAARVAQTEASEDSLRLADARYKAGLDAYLGVLDAQRTAYAARQGLIGARLSDAANRVTLYKVLGGGGS